MANVASNSNCADDIIHYAALVAKALTDAPELDLAERNHPDTVRLRDRVKVLQNLIDGLVQDLEAQS